MARGNLEVTFCCRSPLIFFLISSSILTFSFLFFPSLTWRVSNPPPTLHTKELGWEDEREMFYFFWIRHTHTQTHARARSEMKPEVMNKASDVMRLLLDEDNPMHLCIHAPTYTPVFKRACWSNSCRRYGTNPSEEFFWPFFPLFKLHNLPNSLSCSCSPLNLFRSLLPVLGRHLADRSNPLPCQWLAGIEWTNLNDCSWLQTSLSVTFSGLKLHITLFGVEQSNRSRQRRLDSQQYLSCLVARCLNFELFLTFATPPTLLLFSRFHAHLSFLMSAHTKKHWFSLERYSIAALLLLGSVF